MEDEMGSGMSGGSSSKAAVMIFPSWMTGSSKSSHIAIDKTATGSIIRDNMGRPAHWSYSYPGSPMEVLQILTKANAVVKKGSEWFEPNDGLIDNVLESNTKFKEITNMNKQELKNLIKEEIKNVLKEQTSNMELIGPNIDELLDAINFINKGVTKTNKPRPHSFGFNTLKALANDGHSIPGGKFSIGVTTTKPVESTYVRAVNELLDDHGFECKLYITK